MRFLIDANMPRSVADLLKRFDHEAVDVRDIGMGGAADADIAVYAQQNGLVILTRDFDFADIRNYPPFQYPGLLVLALPEDAVATFVVRVLDRGVARSPRDRRTGTRAPATASKLIGHFATYSAGWSGCCFSDGFLSAR